MPKVEELVTANRRGTDDSSPPGALMKDPSGCVVFVSTRHDRSAVYDRLAAGWSFPEEEVTPLPAAEGMGGE